MLFDQVFATADELIRIERKRRRDIDIGSVDVGLRGNEGVFLFASERTSLTPSSPKFEDIFEPTGPPTTMVEHLIETGDHSRNGESPWGSSTVLVLKKDGGMRVCVDYHQLNKVTVLGHNPIPKVDDLLHPTGNTKVMSTLDLRSVYH